MEKWKRAAVGDRFGFFHTLSHDKGLLQKTMESTPLPGAWNKLSNLFLTRKKSIFWLSLDPIFWTNSVPKAVIYE
jgi:hypothetical protein